MVFHMHALNGLRAMLTTSSVLRTALCCHAADCPTNVPAGLTNGDELGDVSNTRGLE